MSTNIPRKTLLFEKGTICCNCQKDVGNKIQYHHIVPLAIGGKDIISNLCSICSNCHSLVHNFKMSNSELVKQGIAKKRASGFKWGRPKISQEIIESAIKDYQENAMNATQVCNKYGISRTTLYNYLRINK